MVEEENRFNLKGAGRRRFKKKFPWVGESAVCVGQTQNGKSCTRSGRLEHEGKPLCSQYYPLETHYERRKQEERSRSEYQEERRATLERYRELEQTFSGLSQMHRELSTASFQPCKNLLNQSRPGFKADACGSGAFNQTWVDTYLRTRILGSSSQAAALLAASSKCGY